MAKPPRTTKNPFPELLSNKGFYDPSPHISDKAQEAKGDRSCA